MSTACRRLCAEYTALMPGMLFGSDLRELCTEIHMSAMPKIYTYILFTDEIHEQ